MITMRLKDYISQTIIEISEGIKQAQEKTDDTVKVNPKQHSLDDRFTEIEFNISVSEKSEHIRGVGVGDLGRSKATGLLEFKETRENVKPHLNFKINVILPETEN